MYSNFFTRLFLLIGMIGMLSAPVLAQGRGEIVEIGQATTGTTLSPIYTPKNYSFTQQLYTAEEIGTDGTITNIAFHWAFNGSKTFGIDVYMKHTERAYFETSADRIPLSASDKVFTGTINPDHDSWITITLDEPFEYDGSSNLVIAVHRTSGSPGFNDLDNNWNVIPTWYYTYTDRYTMLYMGDDQSQYVSLTPAYMTPSNNRPNIQIEISSATTTCKAPKNFTAADVTNNSATLTWTAGSEEQTNWDVYYNTSNVTPDENTVPTFQVTECTKVLTGLTAQTTYYAYVRSVCSSDDKSRWASTNFTTTREACHVGADSPYEQDFETNNDWTFANGTLTNQWHYGNATHNGNGSNAIYISDDNGTTNHYTINKATMVYASKLFNFDQGTYTFSFDWNTKGESSYDFIRVALVPGDKTFTAGASLPSGVTASSLPNTWIALDGGSKLNQSNGWQTKVSENVLSGTYTMVFLWRNDNSTGTQPPAAIDNVSITRTYPQPSSFSAYQVGADYAVLAWQENSGASQWDLQYATDANFTNPVEVSGGTDNDFQVNGNFVGYGFLGLNSGTKYFARVRSVIGQHHSDWTVVSFQTDCADLSLPYYCDFESNLDENSFPMPICWNRNGVTIQRNTYPYVYESASSSNYQYAHGEGANSSSGHCMWFYKSTQTATETAILPPVESGYEMNQLQIRLWARLYSTTYAGKTLEIGIMTTPTATSTFESIGTITVGGDASNAHTDYEEFVVPFTNYTGDGRYIAIRAGATMGSNVVQILVDDITVEETPAILTNQTVELHQGWNWFAPIVDITLEQLETALGANGISINSQNQFARYDVEDEEWSGDLLALVPGQMYKIEVSADCNFTLTGIPTTSITINIEHGSNWFGYTGSETVTIEEALIGFTPVEGDKITSEDGKFTIYEDDEWGGDLLNLAPGKGYIYISQDTESKQFIITRNN